MSPFPVLPKVVAFSAFLVCSAPASPTDTDATVKVSAPKSASLHCRRYFGCVPLPKGQTDKVSPITE